MIIVLLKILRASQTKIAEVFETYVSLFFFYLGAFIICPPDWNMVNVPESGNYDINFSFKKLKVN